MDQNFMMEKSKSSNALMNVNAKQSSLFTETGNSMIRRNVIWTIPKAKRFHTRESITKDIPLINPGSALKKSSTSLGYGKRYKFRSIETPACSLTHRDLINSHKKLIKSNHSDSNCRLSPSKKDSSPGPGSYNVLNAVQDEKKGILIKSRKFVKDSRQDYPGPDHYEPSQKIYFRNRFKDVRFGTSKRSDFTMADKDKSPGPASYDLVSGLDMKMKEIRIKNQLRIERMKIESRVLRT